MVDYRQALSPTKGYQDMEINWGMRLSKKGSSYQKRRYIFKRGVYTSFAHYD